jgi:hypothetical protein
MRVHPSDVITPAMGVGLGRFLEWSTPRPAVAKPPVRQIDVQDVGRSLGWAPTSWLHHFDDLLPRPPMPKAAFQDLLPVDDRFVPTLAFFGGWTADPLPKPLPNRPTAQELFPLDDLFIPSNLFEYLPNADPVAFRVVTRSAETVGPIDSTTGTTPTEFVPWSQDPTPSAVVRRVVDQPYLGSSIGWAPTTWTRWVEDLLARPVRTAPAETVAPLDALQGVFPTGFIAWSLDPQPSKIVSRQADTQDVRTSLGWAPTSWVHWAEDLLAKPVRTVQAETVAPLDPLQGVFPTGFVPWSVDPGPSKIVSRQADTQDVRTSIGWAPTSWVQWTGEPAPQRSYRLAAETAAPLDPALGLDYAPFVPWASTDPMPRPSLPRPVAQELMPLDDRSVPPLAYFGGWVPEVAWQHPPYTREAVQAPYPLDVALPAVPLLEFLPNPDPPPFRVQARRVDQPYLGSTIGFAPVVFQTWTVDPQPFRVVVKPAISDAPLDPAIDVAVTPYLAWSEPTWRPVRIAPTAADLLPLDDRFVPVLAYMGGWVAETAWQHPPYTREAVQAPYPLDQVLPAVPILEFLPNQDPLPAKVVTRRAETPDVWKSIGWAPTSWVQWVPDLFAKLVRTLPVEGASPLGPSMGVFPAGFVQWAPDPVQRSRVANPYDVGQVWPSSSAALSRFLAWAPDAQGQAQRTKPADPSAVFAGVTLGVRGGFVQWAPDVTIQARLGRFPDDQAPLSSFVPPSLAKFLAWTLDGVRFVAVRPRLEPDGWGFPAAVFVIYITKIVTVDVATVSIASADQSTCIVTFADSSGADIMTTDLSATVIVTSDGPAP